MLKIAGLSPIHGMIIYVWYDIIYAIHCVGAVIPMITQDHLFLPVITHVIILYIHVNTEGNVPCAIPYINNVL